MRNILRSICFILLVTLIAFSQDKSLKKVKKIEQSETATAKPSVVDVTPEKQLNEKEKFFIEYALDKLTKEEREKLLLLLNSLYEVNRIGDTALKYLKYSENFEEAKVLGFIETDLNNPNPLSQLYYPQKYLVVKMMFHTYLLEKSFGSWMSINKGTYLARNMLSSVEIIDDDGVLQYFRVARRE